VVWVVIVFHILQQLSVPCLDKQNVVGLSSQILHEGDWMLT